MQRRGRLRRWPLDNKFQFCTIVVAIAAGIVVPVVLARTRDGGGGNSAQIATNNAQVNIGGTVNNYLAQPSAADPNPNGPSVQSNTCPVRQSPRRGDTLAGDLLVRRYRSGECWTKSATIGLTPSTIEYEISYVNTSNVVQKDVGFGVKLAKGLQMVPGTTYILNSSYPRGKRIDTDAIDSNGVILGSYTPGANAYVAFEVETPAVGDLKCGSNVLRTIATVQPKALNYFYNTADVDLSRSCNTPSSGAS